MFRDPRSGACYLTVRDVARRWEMQPASVTKYHMKVGGLSGVRSAGQIMISGQALAEYEKRLRKDVEGRISRLKKLLARMDAPIDNCAIKKGKGKAKKTPIFDDGDDSED